MGGISIYQLLIILVIVLVLFGTKKLRNLGSDLGNAFKGFKKAIKDEEQKDESETEQIQQQEKTINSETETEKQAEKQQDK